MTLEVKAVTGAGGVVTDGKLLAAALRAHRFYSRGGLTISSFHFAKKLSSRDTGIRLT